MEQNWDLFPFTFEHIVTGSSTGYISCNNDWLEWVLVKTRRQFQYECHVDML
jgi:hypothetical protein